MAKFHRYAPVRLERVSKDSHISIGRRLTDAQLEVAKRMFGQRKIDIRFLCDRISLRKFDPGKGQYFIAREFPFGHERSRQTSLF